MMIVKEIEIKNIKQVDNSRSSKNQIEDVHELMSSIEKYGLLQPIGVVDKENYYAVAWGNRRLNACKKLGLPKIPAVIVDENLNETDYLIINTVENIQRKNIGLFDIGRVCVSLKKLGLNVDEIAVRLGIAKNKVNDSIEAFKYLPEKHRGVVKSITDKRRSATAGKISTTVSKYVLMLRKDVGLTKLQVEELLDLAIKHNLNYRNMKIISRFIRSGLTIKQAYDKSKEYTIIEVWFPVKLQPFEKLKKDRGCNNNQEMVIDILANGFVGNKDLLLKSG